MSMLKSCFGMGVARQPTTLSQVKPSFTEKLGRFFTNLGSLRRKSSNSSQSSQVSSRIGTTVYQPSAQTAMPTQHASQHLENAKTPLHKMPGYKEPVLTFTDKDAAAFFRKYGRADSAPPKPDHLQSGTNLPNSQLLALHGQPLENSPPLLNSYDSLASLKTQLSSDEELTSLDSSASYLTLGDDIKEILDNPPGSKAEQTDSVMFGSPRARQKSSTPFSSFSSYGSAKSNFDSDFAELESLASQPSTTPNSFAYLLQQKSLQTMIKEINAASKQQKAEEAHVALPAKPLTRQASSDSVTSYATEDPDDGRISDEDRNFGNTNYGSEITLMFSDNPNDYDDNRDAWRDRTTQNPRLY